MKVTSWVLGLLIGLGGQNAFALAILEKLDQSTELNKLTFTQRQEGRYQLILMLVRCEFRETCLIAMIDDLKIIGERTKNPMYLVYMNYLKTKKPELMEQASRCQIPEKQIVRKAVAECLQQMIIKEGYSKALSRKAIDQLQDERDQCLKAKMEEIAKTGNLFAQAMLVNIFEQTRDSKKLDYWYNEMQKKANTKEYNAYMLCPDIP